MYKLYHKEEPITIKEFSSHEEALDWLFSHLLILGSNLSENDFEIEEL